MNVILHGDGEKRMHLSDCDVVHQKITVPVKIFSPQKNKWADPVYVNSELVYKFSCQIGSYYHYRLENNNARKTHA